MSDDISLVRVWINFISLLSSVLRNCFYSLFELIRIWWGVVKEVIVKSMYVCYCVSFKL